MPSRALGRICAVPSARAVSLLSRIRCDGSGVVWIAFLSTVRLLTLRCSPIAGAKRRPLPQQARGWRDRSLHTRFSPPIVRRVCVLCVACARAWCGPSVSSRLSRVALATSTSRPTVASAEGRRTDTSSTDRPPSERAHPRDSHTQRRPQRRSARQRQNESGERRRRQNESRLPLTHTTHLSTARHTQQLMSWPRSTTVSETLSTDPSAAAGARRRPSLQQRAPRTRISRSRRAALTQPLAIPLIPLSTQD